MKKGKFRYPEEAQQALKIAKTNLSKAHDTTRVHPNDLFELGHWISFVMPLGIFCLFAYRWHFIFTQLIDRFFRLIIN
jgi:hypothetical protein